MATTTFRIWRGDASGGSFEDYKTDVTEGMVVLEAESICRDVLAIEPEDQTALATLLLSLSDQFPHGLSGRFREAKDLVGQLTSEYEREYYTGMLSERRAKCQHRKGTPGCGHLAYQGLQDAMEHYERAKELSPAGNDDAVLRWNTCARIIDANPGIEPEAASHATPSSSNSCLTTAVASALMSIDSDNRNGYGASSSMSSTVRSVRSTVVS